MGKPIGTHAGDVEEACRFTNYVSGLAEVASGETSLNTPDHLNLSLRQPYGVVAAIVAWNFPTLLVSSFPHLDLSKGRLTVLALQWCHEVSAACGAGNAMIIKVRQL
jgi:aldehyde dehydrogenase (NAD+)